jgi:hypothetical protein
MFWSMMCLWNAVRSVFSKCILELFICTFSDSVFSLLSFQRSWAKPFHTNSRFQFDLLDGAFRRERKEKKQKIRSLVGVVRHGKEEEGGKKLIWLPKFRSTSSCSLMDLEEKKRTDTPILFSLKLISYVDISIYSSGSACLRFFLVRDKWTIRY